MLLITLSAISSWGYITVGIHDLIIPAFSAAISSRVFPKRFVWSKLIDVITDNIGVITLVESSLPPRPTSTTAKSTSSVAKYKNINTVIISNSVGWLYPSSITLSTAYLIFVISCASFSFGIFSPLIWILSSNSSKNGEVYIPTL